MRGAEGARRHLARGADGLVPGLVGAALGLLAARVIAPDLLRGFALGDAVRNVGLLWIATIALAPPEGELVMMLGTLWTLLLPAVLGLRNWRLLGLDRTLLVPRHGPGGFPHHGIVSSEDTPLDPHDGSSNHGKSETAAGRGFGSSTLSPRRCATKTCGRVGR